MTQKAAIPKRKCGPGVLTHPDLQRAWRTGHIRFEPDINEEQIGEASIDLRLGSDVTLHKPRNSVIIKPAQGFDPNDHVERHDLRTGALGGVLKLKPGDFALALVKEKIWIPRDLVAAVQGKSSLARAGVAVHITAPHIHPGWHGHLALEIFNHSRWELQLEPDDLVCQVIFYTAVTPLPEEVAASLGSYVDQTSAYPSRRRPPAPVAARSTSSPAKAGRRRR